MARLRNKPYFWVTWLAPLLVGEDNCGGKVWLKGQYQDLAKRPRDEERENDLAAWNENHTALLGQLRGIYGPPRCKQMLVEGETAWKIEGKTAIVAGKMDLITLGPNLVVDAKSGKPKESHVVQMKIYLLALELGGVAGVKGNFRGVLCYPGNRQTRVAEADKEFREHFFELVRELAGEQMPAKVPSLYECRFCDLADCDVRFEEAAAAQTDAF